MNTFATMVIKSAEFVMSNTDPSKCPEGRRDEFAFIGRSNVGKSSLINLLMDRKSLAKTSSTPGKTQTINHYIINNKWYLVDLPGYGYANTPKEMKYVFGGMIATYLKKRTNLITTFVLLDPRHNPQPIDLDFIRWMGEQQLPFALVFTKTDKLTRHDLNMSLKTWTEALQETWEELPPIFITSAEKRVGREELLKYISTLLSKY
ncbi:MAG TPA: ribosome biogenesis GTP-binding protein YihA/YsxC [Cyclobacteriaceae bacterium]|nr:ribosome biogenesis GTP-binding protein YihA/YsxC [Cyclobacteriaceae bacterium]